MANGASLRGKISCRRQGAAEYRTLHGVSHKEAAPLSQIGRVAGKWEAATCSFVQLIGILFLLHVLWVERAHSI